MRTRNLIGLALALTISSLVSLAGSGFWLALAFRRDGADGIELRTFSEDGWDIVSNTPRRTRTP
jgi:hypothetical protein